MSINDAPLYRAAEPDYAVPPGETLRERLEELGMSQADLARRTGLTPKHIHLVLKGSATLSADVAQRLEFATGTPTRWWLRLEADYQAALLRLAHNRLAEEESAWVKSMPVRDLVAVGALPDSPSQPAQRLRQLLRFFGVASVEAYWRVWGEPAAAFRQSKAFTVKDAAVTAWLRLGEQAARERFSASAAFEPAALEAALPRLRELTSLPPRQGFEAFVEQCLLVGVVLVVVPEIAGARAFGATRWLGAGRRPLIQLSLRGKTDNMLWFTAFHELGHVLRHDRKNVYVETDEQALQDRPDTAAEEREANHFAWSVLIPERYQPRLSQLQTDADVLDLAEELEIAPSLVVARLQFDGRWTHRQGSRLKRPVDVELLTGERQTDASTRVSKRTGRGLPGGDGND